MSGQNGSSGTMWRGAVIAAALSAGFLGLLAATSLAIAAVVAVPAALVVSVLRTRAVSRPAHVLEPAHFEGTVVIAAPRASEVAAAPATGRTAVTAA